VKSFQPAWVAGLAVAAFAGAFAAVKPANDYGKLPLTFEANAGQTDSRVRYLSRGAGYTLFLTSDNEAVLSLARSSRHGERQTAAVRMSMPGARPAPEIRALGLQPTVSNYLIGADPNKWLTGVAHYGRVSYQNIYPGIDVVYYGNHRQLEYDFVVAPGADPGRIRVKFDGAERITKDTEGNLVLQTSLGPVRQLKPVVYQEVDGERRYVAAAYTLRGNEAGFRLGEYDRSRELIIDPILVYSTFLGGTGVENGYAVAVDTAQAAYVVGSTSSVDFPAVASLPGQGSNRGPAGTLDAFVTKFSPEGTSIAFSTYIGGAANDEATGVGLDSSGNILVAGTTSSANFPTRNPLQGIYGGKVESFLLKIAAGGELIYSTYIGGFEDDHVNGLAVDANDNVLLGGVTRSSNFWASGGLRPAFQGGVTDGWVFKMSSAGQRIWSTYLGGFGNDSANGVAVDAQGDVYVTGTTTSLGFPVTAGALQPTIAHPSNPDAFVTKIQADGTAFLYSTYLGGTNFDEGIDIRVDAQNQAFVTGNTDSIDFPALNPLQGPPGNRDVFVTKMNANGTGMLFSTFLAGSNQDTAAGIALDPQGAAYILGSTSSSDFPTASPIQSGLAGGRDLFLTKIDSAGTARQWSTYLGGTSNDTASGIAVDASSSVYIAGSTGSADFPRLRAAQNGLLGTQDAFVTKISGCDISLAPASVTFGAGATSGSFTVNAATCPWFVSSTTPWITITGATSGTDTAIITYTIQGNAGVARSGSISVSGVRFTITQAGLQATAPTVTGIAPTGGGGIAQIFTARYATANPGGAPIEHAYLLINTAVSGAGACLVQYSPGANSFRMITDNGASWSEPVIAGSVASASNSQCTLDAAASSGAITSGTGVSETTVSFALTFAGSFAGVKNTYLLANNETSGLNSGWIQTGTWTVSSGGGQGGAPAIGGITPASGSGNGQAFAARYFTSTGNAAISRAYLLVNTSINGTGGCLIEYAPATNSFRAIANDGATWSAPVIAGTATTIGNSQCTLNTAASSGSATSGAGTTNTNVNYSLSFAQSFAGAKNVYLLAISENSGLNSGWIQSGTWTVTGTAPGAGPGVASLTPISGANTSNTFTGVFTHSGGANQHYLGYMLFLPTPNVVNYNATGTCLIEYNRISNGIRLIDDAGTGWLGPLEGLAIGTPGASVSNNYCTVNIQNTTAIVAGANMTVIVPVTFKSTLGPVLGTFLQAQDVNGVWTGMTQFGNWTLPGAPAVRTGPTVNSVTPVFSVGSGATYTVSASHPSGVSALQSVHLLISDRIVGSPACHVYYVTGNNTLNLIGDNNLPVSLTGVTPGTNVTLSNNRCSVNFAGSGVGVTGNRYTITLPLTFNKTTFAGTKNAYGIAFDNTGLTSHWVQSATLTVE
jgi:Beta-propeller repeat